MLAEVAGPIMVLGGKAGGTLGVERSRVEAKLGIEVGMLSQVGQQLACSTIALAVSEKFHVPHQRISLVSQLSIQNRFLSCFDSSGI